MSISNSQFPLQLQLKQQQQHWVMVIQSPYSTVFETLTTVVFGVETTIQVSTLLDGLNLLQLNR